ncbi:MAG: metalloregulator ArsR/SmtB family transcription factor [Kiritimatiellales bacterium]|nr:metalloregulator ArsR/SmtB family transcription factor [Kiritimatiellales bacterium]
MGRLRPTLWRTCRALANPMRLTLLRHLFEAHELRVCDLANKAGISEKLASNYLRILNARGLIGSRTEGRWVFYSAEANPEVDNAALILQTVRNCCHSGMTNTEIFRCATAFTHTRRIGIISQLHGQSLRIDELSIKTQIPYPSLIRHLRKLEKRGMVRQQNDRYEMSLPENMLGLTLVQIVLQSRD